MAPILTVFKPKTYFTHSQLQHLEIPCSTHNAFVFCMDLTTAIISLYNINLSVFITEVECLVSGTIRVFK
jgi:hypothetical protein